MSSNLRTLCPGYAALNLDIAREADGNAVVQSRTVIDPGRAPTGGPIPPRDLVTLLLDDGSVLDLSFQMVCIPAVAERPRLDIEPGERVRVWASKEGLRVSACIWDNDGDLIVAAACLQPVGPLSLGPLELSPGPLRRSGGPTWEHDVEVRWGQYALTLPAGGWHRLEERADLTGLALRAEAPSAQVSHLRFGLLARR
jgi:hypothetical protein